MVKRFNLDHLYDMLKDQPKWKMLRNPTTNLGLGSWEKSNSETEGGANETVGVGEKLEDGGERTEGRKATKRRLKEKANNTIIDLVTN